jgi:hypothetical protein
MLDTIFARIHEKRVFPVGAYGEFKRSGKGMHVLVVAPRLNSTVPLASCQGKVAHNDRSVVVMTLPRPGVRSKGVLCRLTRDTLSDSFFIIALAPAVHVLPKHDDLMSTHAKWLLDIRMQAFKSKRTRENDVRASSVGCT